VRATSTNTLGFILWTVALTLVSWTATLAGTWFQYKGENAERPLQKAIRSSLWPSVFEAVGICALVLCAWSIFIAKTIYDDHRSQVSSNAQLMRENLELAAKLKDAKENAEHRCEQAKQIEIDGLRKRIRAACYLPDRRLTDEQRDELFHLLKKLKQQNPKIASIAMCVQSYGDMDSVNFASQLQKVFHDAEWTQIPCNKTVLETIAKTSISRGIVFVDPNRNSYVSMTLQAKFISMGLDVSPFFPQQVPEQLQNLMLLVGYKVGYQGTYYPD